MVNPENNIEGGFEEKLTRKEIIALAKEIIEKGEVLPFSGMDPKAYEGSKAAELEYPGFTTPIDEILERLTKEGMKIVPKNFRFSDNDSEFFVLPAQSNDIVADSISLRQLAVSESLPENLKKI